MQDDRLVIAGREFKSRLWVGTGKYKDFVETKKAIDTAGADVVTVAVRRVNVTDPKQENLLDYVDPKKYLILPNTAGCSTAEEAIRTARLAREAGVGVLYAPNFGEFLFHDVGRIEAKRKGRGC